RGCGSCASSRSGARGRRARCRARYGSARPSTPHWRVPPGRWHLPSASAPVSLLVVTRGPDTPGQAAAQCTAPNANSAPRGSALDLAGRGHTGAVGRTGGLDPLDHVVGDGVLPAGGGQVVARHLGFTAVDALGPEPEHPRAALIEDVGVLAR